MYLKLNLTQNVWTPSWTASVTCTGISTNKSTSDVMQDLLAKHDKPGKGNGGKRFLSALGRQTNVLDKNQGFHSGTYQRALNTLLLQTENTQCQRGWVLLWKWEDDGEQTDKGDERRKNKKGCSIFEQTFMLRSNLKSHLSPDGAISLWALRFLW